MKKIFLSVFILLTLVITEGFCEEEIKIPSSFDLRREGYAPAIGDQGRDQTCWTFSTLSAVESNYLFRTKIYPCFSSFLGNDSRLSKLHLAWYSFKNPDNKKNFAYVRNGIVISPSDSEILNHSGNPQMALAFLSRHDGPIKEADLPYGSSYPAAGTSPGDYKTALRVVGAYYVEPLNISLNEGDIGDVFVGEGDLLKAYLLLHGAVSAGVYWDTKYMSSPSFAYYNPSSRKGGHAITIIGWDDNYSRDNFSPVKPEKNGAWLVQNSWGMSWGNSGCFWMSYEQLLRFAMAFEVEEVNNRVREYYHDALGFTSEINLSDNANAENFAAVANVFKVKGDHEKLREVGFYSTNSIYKADTVILDLGTENSLENFLSRAENIENLKVMDSYVGLGERGYVVHLLEKPVELSKDHYFAIAMMMSPSSSDFNPTIAAEVKIPNYRTANAEINAQETYFTNDGKTWQDAKYHKFLIGTNEITGFNACIKGFTYVPDERLADDWKIISDDGKAQLSISILKETEPDEIIAKGSGIENILHKVEPENSSTGDSKGKFYTLKLIGDLTSDDAKLTSLKINGEEVITGSIKNIKFETNILSEDKYFDSSKIGVSLKEMTQASGVIESTDGYKENSEKKSNGNGTTTDDNNNTFSSGGSGGCNSEISLLSFGMLFLFFRRKIK